MFGSIFLRLHKSDTLGLRLRIPITIETRRGEEHPRVTGALSSCGYRKINLRAPINKGNTRIMYYYRVFFLFRHRDAAAARTLFFALRTNYSATPCSVERERATLLTENNVNKKCILLIAPQLVFMVRTLLLHDDFTYRASARARAILRQ